ncbi:hypothetical protein [Sediminibacter sp. Hel_I_10]|nr:hypothetical protein [Sediminibacter sp. Hel_I_10]
MKTSYIILALASPLLLTALVLAYPFYLVYKLIDETPKGTKLTT